MLALDWRQAFDCISPERLLVALKRFGVSKPMLEAIQDIYRERYFMVQDGGHVSNLRQQDAGIVQGCPLSPFLFGMLMSVLMTDACEKLSDSARAARTAGKLDDVLFADDTLLISSSGEHLEDFTKIHQRSCRLRSPIWLASALGQGGVGPCWCHAVDT